MLYRYTAVLGDGTEIDLGVRRRTDALTLANLVEGDGATGQTLVVADDSGALRLAVSAHVGWRYLRAAPMCEDDAEEVVAFGDGVVRRAACCGDGSYRERDAGLPVGTRVVLTHGARHAGAPPWAVLPPAADGEVLATVDGPLDEDGDYLVALDNGETFYVGAEHVRRYRPGEFIRTASPEPPTGLAA